MPPVTVTQWGNSLGLRLPKSLARQLDIHPGQQVDVEAKDGALVVRPHRRRRRYTLKELCAGMSKKNIHPEVDWGPPVGSEII